MKRLICFFLLVTTTVFTQPQTIENVAEAVEGAALLTDKARPEPAAALTFQQDEVWVNIGFYGAVNSGIFQSILPSFGTSFRAQRGANGIELGLSVWPYDWEDSDAGLSYKADLSYLYHFSKERSGMYLGGGPGLIANRDLFHPVAVSWLGYQFSSSFHRKGQLHGFVDGGVTSIFDWSQQAIGFAPVFRGGLGFTF